MLRVRATWTHKALVKCFSAIANAAKKNMSSNRMLTLEEQHQRLNDLNELVTSKMESVDLLVRNKVDEMYFSTEEARRQHKINSFMRSALSRMKRLQLAMCWSKWAAEIKRKKRVAHLGAKALGRFKNLLLAKCFQPWSGMARREVLEKHSATSGKNYEMLSSIKRMVDDHQQVFEGIFNKRVLDS